MFKYIGDSCLNKECWHILYIVQLHDFKNSNNRSHKNCRTVDTQGTRFDTHCRQHNCLKRSVCREREGRYTGLINGLPYSPVADFSVITSYRNIFCTPGCLHNAQSTHSSNSTMTRAISGQLNIHFCCVAGHSVRPTAPPSSFTPALC